MAKSFKVEEADVGEEDILGVVAPLGGVMRNAWSDEAGFSGHRVQYGLARGLSPSSSFPGLKNMPLQMLLTLSAAMAVVLSTFELLITVHLARPYIDSMAIVYRILAVNAVAILVLCLVTGAVGSRLHRLVALSRDRAGVAGALSPLIPCLVYLGRMSPDWLHGQHWIWFVFGMPASFLLFAAVLRAEPRLSAEKAIGLYWPAIAPIAVWTLCVQHLRQGRAVTLLASLPVGALAWVLGTIAIALLIRSWPRAGHAWTVGCVAAVLLAAFGSSTAIDLNRQDTLLTPASAEHPL